MLSSIRKTSRVLAPATWAIIAAIAGGAVPLRAQPRGEGPLVLRLPASARFLAMGGAGLATNDADAVIYNPSMLSLARGFAGSVQRYGSHGATGALSTVTTSGSLVIGIGAQLLEWSAPFSARYGDAVRAGAPRLSDDGGIAASSSAFTIGVARTIKGLRLGGSAKYAEDRVGSAHDGTVAFDIGVMRALGPANVTLLAQNLGPGLGIAGERGTLPRRVGLGYGGGLYPLWEHWDLGAQIQVALEGDLFVRPAAGIELGYVPIEGVALVVRGGGRRPRERDDAMVTGGLGIVIDRINVDYAIEPMRGGRPLSHRVGIRLK